MSIRKTRNNSGRTCSVIAFTTVLFSLFILMNAGAETPAGKTNLKQGKEDLDAGRYEESIRSLSLAQKDFPLLGDYALYFLSSAYANLGNHRKSLECLRTLKETFPQSPLLRKVRASEIKEARECRDENVLALYETYLHDYPADEDIAMGYANLLKQKGESARATDLFKRIYLKAGSQSASAFAQLKSSDIKPEEVVERASNLMKGYHFKAAEQELRKALSGDSGKSREELLKSLGYSLFRQKRYNEASLIYDQCHDLYYKARSLYRAGDKQGFEAALADLLKGDDVRAGGLLMSRAADRRRQKNYEEALKVYNEVINRFPALSEDAMWGTGWTYYTSGDFKKSSELFSQIYSKYGDPKYLYWEARSKENLAEDAGDLYSAVMKSENNYYSALAFARNKGGAKPVSFVVAVPSSLPGIKKNNRVDALLSLGMTKEAVTELAWIGNRADTPSVLMYAASKFLELGEFRRSILLASKLPYSSRTHDFWYPLAFWDDVQRISRKYGIDPIVILSVMREESRFDVNAKSITGARGLMQMMPDTAFRLDKDLKLGIKKENQMYDAKVSIHLGAYYLKSLFTQFKSLPYVLAAYNAGDMSARRWQDQIGTGKPVDEFVEEIPYTETRNYVKKVVTSYYQYKRSISGAKGQDELTRIMGSL